MTEEIDNDDAIEEIDPAGLYLFTWYVALHFDDFKHEKIMHDTLVGDVTNWTEIVNRNGGDVGLPSLPIVWEARSGGLTNPDRQIFGTQDPLINTTYHQATDDLRLLLSEAKSQLEKVKGKYTPGNLTNDPKLRLFFDSNLAWPCQIKFPDQTVITLHRPKEDGILLYYIERFIRYKPCPREILQVLMEQARQQLAEVEKSDGKGLEWASAPI